MCDYRIYVLDRDGHIEAAHECLAADDEVAIAVARHIDHEHGLEVWQRARRVALLTVADRRLEP